MRLFERRLLLVSGKGGVGKTTITAALATLAARSGLKVLLCELDRNGQLARLFNCPSHKMEKDAAKNVTLLYVDPEAAMEEYLKIYLRIRQIYEPIVQSPVMNYFLQAAPGFRELLIIGKIWWETQLEEGKPRRHKWDMVLVDTPATGHGISFMGVAQAVMSMVKIGPIHNQAKRMVKTLQDDRYATLVTVSLPEEMPVSETVDLVWNARENLGIPIGPVVMNGMPPPVFGSQELNEWRELSGRVEGAQSTSPKLKALVACARMGRKRWELALQHRRNLRKRLPGIEMVDVPYIFRWNWDIDTINEIAGYLQRGLDL